MLDDDELQFKQVIRTVKDISAAIGISYKSVVVLNG